MTANASPSLAAGGDPFAAAFEDNPYNVFPRLKPNSGMKAILRAQLEAQRIGISERQDSALRTLRDLNARLIWDLFTLGTTPGVAVDFFDELRALVASGDREGALVLCRSGRIASAGPEAAHVAAVLSANELIGSVSAPGLGQGRIDDAVVRRFIAFWASVLHNDVWLTRFANARCALWALDGGNATFDVADQIRFSERSRAFVDELLARAAAGDEVRLKQWRAAWLHESVAIEVLDKACGWGDPPSGVPRGFGPRGLSELGRLDALSKAMAELLKHPRRSMALSLLKEGQVDLQRADKKLAATAAAAVALLFSDLGDAAAPLWGVSAFEVPALADRQNPSLLRWFGSEQGLSLARTELHAESCLLRFRDELSREHVPVQMALASAKTLLHLAEQLSHPTDVVEALERKVLGRAVACIEARTLPHPGEFRRVLDLCSQVHEFLVERGAGDQVGQAVAQLLVRRAANVWNRCKGLPRTKDRQRILRDLFGAVELAPHSIDIAESLASVVEQVSVGLPPAERRALLERARLVLDDCDGRNGGSTQLSVYKRRIAEQLEPEAALSDAWDDVQRILDEVRKG